MSFNSFLNRLKSGKNIGITSICSANKYVIEAAILHAQKYGYDLLIESTSNQVDQYGGYTGMTPEKFIQFVTSIAKKNNFPLENLTFGGDHLGTNTWKNTNSDKAMKNAEDLIRAYVSAGYSKIHLDTSFKLIGDNLINGKLSSQIITKRAAQLCKVAEKAYTETKAKNSKPFYIIGTDVPIPGGAIDNEEEIELTTPDALEETIELTKESFYDEGLEEAWERVIGVVVQPGVEFSDSKILEYSRTKNKQLIAKLKEYPALYFEAHSTDYQKCETLCKMVEDNFAILKVGPWLTYALREALFSLAYIENELFKFKDNVTVSNFFNVIETVMTENSKYWANHYQGTKTSTYLLRNFGYSDRIRYYWAIPKVDKTVNHLISNLNNIEVPDCLISQFMPVQYNEIKNGAISKNVYELITSKISEVLSTYFIATGGKIEN